MVLVGSACQLHLELREPFKLLRIRLLVNHRLSRLAFLCGCLNGSRAGIVTLLDGAFVDSSHAYKGWGYVTFSH